MIDIKTQLSIKILEELLDITIKRISYENNLIFIWQDISNGFDDYDRYVINDLLKLKKEKYGSYSN